MKANWTRDEAIPGLDIVLSHQNEKSEYAPNNHNIEQLSDYCADCLLFLPLFNTIRLEIRQEYNGNYQNLFGGINNNPQDARIGTIFFSLYSEFEDALDRLHTIAEAIRRCEPCYKGIPFGAPPEADGFQEGAFLAHLHRYTEAAYQAEREMQYTSCEICGIIAEGIYGVAAAHFIELHLLIDPADYMPDQKLNADDFIAVCPNCHRILHHTRPWLDRAACDTILA